MSATMTVNDRSIPMKQIACFNGTHHWFPGWICQPVFPYRELGIRVLVFHRTINNSNEEVTIETTTNVFSRQVHVLNCNIVVDEHSLSSSLSKTDNPDGNSSCKNCWFVDGLFFNDSQSQALRLMPFVSHTQYMHTHVVHACTWLRSEQFLGQPITNDEYVFRF